MQYLFQHEEHNVIKLLQHGNNKKKRPYCRLLPSTLDVLKDSKASAKNPKQYPAKFIAPLETITLQGP